jgi:hypothetical protein
VTLLDPYISLSPYVIGSEGTPEEPGGRSPDVKGQERKEEGLMRQGNNRQQRELNGERPCVASEKPPSYLGEVVLALTTCWMQRGLNQ